MGLDEEAKDFFHNANKLLEELGLQITPKQDRQHPNNKREFE